jgi:hypothetical protein
MKYHEFIGCGGWDGEIKKQGHDGAILIDGCPLAEHLGNKMVYGPRSFRRALEEWDLLNVPFRELG